jgi:DNA invertase Pin-like site-specific DNA recombinase
MQMKRVVLYSRVSTDGQSVENQIAELEQVAMRQGWQIVEVLRDKGISGTKDRTKRPGLDRLLSMVARKEVDLIAAWSVDRLGRSLQNLVSILAELHAKGVDLYLHQQGIDTTTPAGKAMFQMMGVFAEFERSMIVERVKAGLKRAKAKGKRLGRPKVAYHKEAKVRQLLSTGIGIRRAARDAGVATSVAQRIAAEKMLT